MKISIVTLSFNQCRFLDEAIRSIIEQDYTEIEYIVVDPGSTDGSRDIIEKYKSKISKIIFEPDKGPADGLNKGFIIATGDIFGFINSDDVLEPGTVAQVVEYFESHPNVDVISGHSWVIDENGDIKRRFISEQYSLLGVAYGVSILSQASTFFRAEIFRRVGGFNTENNSGWDGELFMEMALAGARFSVISSFWSRFRVYSESITGSRRLLTEIQRNQRRFFNRIMGREPNFFDKIISIWMRFVKKISNPSDAFDRLLYGPITKLK